MTLRKPEQLYVAALFVCGPISMLIWSEIAVLGGRGPSAWELMS
ncbi:hypothetical protein [Nocardia gipuzkoensis]